MDQNPPTNDSEADPLVNFKITYTAVDTSVDDDKVFKMYWIQAGWRARYSKYGYTLSEIPELRKWLRSKTNAARAKSRRRTNYWNHQTAKYYAKMFKLSLAEFNKRWQDHANDGETYESCAQRLGFATRKRRDTHDVDDS